MNAEISIQIEVRVRRRRLLHMLVRALGLLHRIRLCSWGQACRLVAYVVTRFELFQLRTGRGRWQPLRIRPEDLM